jgi:hypothetical protein
LAGTTCSTQLLTNCNANRDLNKKAIPLLLANKTDLVGLAKNRNGKTAAGFTFYLIDTNATVSCNFVVPNRESNTSQFEEAFAQFYQLFLASSNLWWNSN